MQTNEFQIFGICGEAGHGKDLVSDWLCGRLNLIRISFSDPMKRLVQQTFGFADEVLWGPSENRNRPVSYKNFEAAGRLPRAAERLAEEFFPNDEEKRFRCTNAIHRWFVDLVQSGDLHTPRVILQTLGTECGRTFDVSMWWRDVHEQKIPAIELGWGYQPNRGLIPPEMEIRQDDKPLSTEVAARYEKEIEKFRANPLAVVSFPADFRVVTVAREVSGVVIPDHRFHNEIEGTRDRGGFVFRVRRLSKVGPAADVGVKDHGSETEQRSIPDEAFDYVLNLPEGLPAVFELLERVFREQPWKR